jgi:hypothetical protein
MISLAWSGELYKEYGYPAYGKDILPDSSGNIYLASSGSFSDRGGFAAKFDSSGNELWTKEYDDTGAYLGNSESLAIDSQGNVYFVGNAAATNQYNDVILVKYSPDGILLWSKKFGAGDRDYGFGIAIDNADNIYITGQGNSLSDSPFGAYDAFIAKYDSAGNKIWIKEFGTDVGNEGARSIVLDSSNNIYIAGNTNGYLNGDTPENYSIYLSTYDAFLAKFDQNGNKIWFKQFGSTVHDEANDLAIDSSDNIYIVGVTDGNLSGLNAGSTDIYVTKFDNNGNQTWIKQFGTSGIDYCGGIAFDSENSIYLAGKTNGNFNEIGQGSELIIKLDFNGEKEWIRQIPGNVGTEAADIAIDSSTNKIYVTGVHTGAWNGKHAFFRVIDSNVSKISTPTTSDISQGLIAYYEFEGNANDSSGNGNHGTEHGGVSYVEGAVGKAGNFDGIDNFIEVAHNQSLSPTNQLSLSLWINIKELPTGSIDWSPIILKGGEATSSWSNREYALWLNKINYLHIASAGDNSGQLAFNTETNKNPINEWFLYTAVIDRVNHSIKVYLNGELVLQEQDTYSSFNNNEENLRIGWTEEISANYGFFNGQIDDLRIYNRVLLEEEINQLYKLKVSSGTETEINKPTLTIDWIRQFENRAQYDEDGIYGIETDKNGYVYVSGATSESLFSANLGNRDKWLAKYDDKGTLVWGKQLGTSLDEAIFRQTVDNDGNIYTSGFSPTDTGFSQTNIAKYDSDGNQVWDRSIPSTESKYKKSLGYDIVLDNLGNIYAIVRATRPLDLATQDERTSFLVKYDNDGTQLWLKQFKEINSIAVDTSGYLYASFIDSNDVISYGKYDSDGNQIWLKENYVGSKISTDSLGNIYGIGNKKFLKYDTNGNQIWEKDFTSGESDVIEDIKVDASNNVYISGYTYGSFTDKGNAGGSDVFYAKYDSDGNQTWIEQFGTSGIERFVTIASYSNNIYLAGTSSGNLSTFGETISDYGSFVAKVVEGIPTTNTEEKTETPSVSEGLIAYYKFEDNVNNSFGNGNNGVEHGGISYVDGVENKAVSFDGVDDYITVEGIELPTDQITYSLWVKPIDSGNVEFVSKHGSTIDASVLIRQEENGRYSTKFTIGGEFHDIVSEVNATKTRFDHLVVRYDSQKLAFFINGKLVNEVDASGEIVTNNFNLTFGGYAPNPSLNFAKFEMDDFRIYNVALSESNITKIYKEFVKTVVSKEFKVGETTVKFENSSVNIENDEITSFDIKSDDTLWISNKDGEKTAKIVFGDGVSLETSNNTLSIKGENNTLYYYIGNNQYAPVSKGGFNLEDGKISEAGLENSLLATKAKSYIDGAYSEEYNNASSEEKRVLLSPSKLKSILDQTILLVGNLSSSKGYPLTANQLLLGLSTRGFTPRNVLLPFFRSMVLDIEENKIEIENAFPVLPNFTENTIETLLYYATLKDVSKAEYSVEEGNITGKISNFVMEVGMFNITTEEASITSSLFETMIVDGKEEVIKEEIELENASFYFRAMTAFGGDKAKELLAKKGVGYGGADLKFIYDPSAKDKYKFISGELGADISFPRKRLSRTLTIKELNAYIKLKFREEDEESTQYLYKDDYSDRLGSVLALIGGDTSIIKKSRTAKFKIYAKLDLAFGENSLRYPLDTLYGAKLLASSENGLAKIGPYLTLTELGGEYQYKKRANSFWKLYAGFSLLNMPNTKTAMFEGKAGFAVDSSFTNYGMELNDLTTPMGASGLKIDWFDNSGGACAILGKEITSEFPISCPDVSYCSWPYRDFKLKPKTEEDGYFKGVGLGVKVSASIKDRYDDIFNVGGIAFQDLFKGEFGAKLDLKRNFSHQSIEFMLSSAIRFPGYTPPFPLNLLTPSFIKKGFDLAEGCVELSTYEISLGYRKKFWGFIPSWKTRFLPARKYYGAYVRAKYYGVGFSLFTPFEDMRGVDNDRVYFATSFRIRNVGNSSARTLNSLGDSSDTIIETFTVADGEESIVFDLISTNNELEVVTPSGQIINQDSQTADNFAVVKDVNFTNIIFSNPEVGAYQLSYKNTGKQTLLVFGGNLEPQASVSLNGSLFSFDLEDGDADEIEYSIALVDEKNITQEILQSEIKASSGSFTYEVPNINYLPTGEYKVALLFKDSVSPLQTIKTTNTINLVKRIPNIQGITALTTDEFTKLDWKEEAGVDGYNLVIKSDELKIYDFNLSTNEETIYSLSEGNYTATIFAFDDNGNEGNSSSLDFTVAKAITKIIPASTTDIQLSFENDVPKLSWNNNGEVAFHKLTLNLDGVVTLDEFITKDNFLYLDDMYVAKQVKVKITSYNLANDSSEPFVKDILVINDADSDNDGLADMWEMTHFMTLDYNGTLDYDFDGLSNFDELSIGTNPSKLDTDGDRISDGEDAYPLEIRDINLNYLADDWEEYYSIVDILADNDNDGYENYLEYFAGLNPHQPDREGIDVFHYKNRDFAPVLVSNINTLAILSLGESFEIDLSDSFDINGQPLTFEWVVNTNNIDNSSSVLSIDTSIVGMHKVEVTVNDGTSSTYRKFSIFVTDGEHQTISAGQDNYISLNKFYLEIPKASMEKGTYFVAGDITEQNIPVDIMGRDIITDGLVFFYSNNHKLEAPISITPYVKDNDEVDPYIFNYSTSIWTNLVTGETFEPIFKNFRVIPNSDMSYSLSTRETGILVFAKKPKDANLSTSMNFDVSDKTYSINLEEFKKENNLSSIEEIEVADETIFKVYLGFVSGKNELMLDALSSGESKISISATNTDEEQVNYIYDVNVTNSQDLVRKTLELNKDWNLISIPVDENITIENSLLYFGYKTPIIWGYDAGKWSGYSQVTETNQKIEEEGFDLLKSLKVGKGYWLLVDEKFVTNFTNTALKQNSIDYLNLPSGWHLLGSQKIQNISEFMETNKNILIIWKFANGQWAVWTNDPEKNSNIGETEYLPIINIDETEGFWLLIENAI